jgi:hypothetical protein
VLGSTAFCLGHHFIPVPVVFGLGNIQRHDAGVTIPINGVYGQASD